MGLFASLLQILKELFVPSSAFKETTETTLHEQRMKLGIIEYREWLKKKLVLMASAKMDREEKGIKVPYDWTEKINLVEKEIKEIEKFVR